MADPTPTERAHLAHIEKNGAWSSELKTSEIPGKGSVSLMICNECHYIVADCNHDINDWYDAAGNRVSHGDAERFLTGVTLKCRLCGLDGT